MLNPKSSQYKQIAASANVSPVPASITGIFCSSSTSGTATVYDSNGTSTATKIVDTFNLVAGTNYDLGFIAAQGLYVVISGTASVTVGYQV